MVSPRCVPLMLPVLVALVVSCKTPSASSVVKDQSDGAPAGACLAAGKIVNASGIASHTPEEIAKNNDGVAQVILSDPAACASTLLAALHRLTAAQPHCDPSAGFSGLLVSEFSQLLGKDLGYRVVLTRTYPTCFRVLNNVNSLDGSKLFFSPLVGKISKGTPLPADSEIIAYDDTKHVYNFYALESGQWQFHGNSLDMLAGPVTINGERRCAGCHVGGGLVMKEIEEPWQNWEANTLLGQTVNPDSKDILAAVAQQVGITGGVELLPPPGQTPSGQPNTLETLDGPTFENIVSNGNTGLWLPTRLQVLKGKLSAGNPAATAELLKPLFCTVEVNLGAMDSTAFPPDLLFDRLLTPTDSLGTWDKAVYTAEIASPAVNQRMNERVDRATGKVLNESANLSKGGVMLRDPTFPFDTLTRSVEDREYTAGLLGLDPGRHTQLPIPGSEDSSTTPSMPQVIDDQLYLAAMLTDFTRPLYSGGAAEMRLDQPDIQPDLTPGRCELRTYAPGVAPDDPNMPATIRSGFIANLKSKATRTPIEDQFLANLQRTDLQNLTELNAYVQACAARNTANPQGFLHDLERIASVQRRLARRLQVVETMALLPADDLAEPDLNLKLNPATCGL